MLNNENKSTYICLLDFRSCLQLLRCGADSFMKELFACLESVACTSVYLCDNQRASICRPHMRWGGKSFYKNQPERSQHVFIFLSSEQHYIHLTLWSFFFYQGDKKNTTLSVSCMTSLVQLLFLLSIWPVKFNLETYSFNNVTIVGSDLSEIKTFILVMHPAVFLKLVRNLIHLMVKENA